MEKEFYNYQWCEREAVRPLMVLRTGPSVKEFQVWREFYDLVSQMRAEHATEIHVKRRRSSLYKILNRIK